MIAPLSLLRRTLLPSVADGRATVAAAPTVPIAVIFRRFWPDARPYLRLFLVSLGLAAVIPLIQTIEIGLFAVVVDRIFVPRDLGPLPGIVLTYLGLMALGSVVGMADSLISVRISGGFLLSLRTRVYRHLLTLAPDTVDKRRLGDVLSRLSGDVNAIEGFVLSGVRDMVEALFKVVLFTGALLLIDVQLTVVSLLIVPLFWAAARFFSRLIKDSARERRRRSGTLNATAEEGLSNLAVVQAYGRERDEVERFHQEGQAILASSIASSTIKAVFGPVVSLIEVAGGVAVITLGTIALAEGRVSFGSLMVFLAYLTKLQSPIRKLTSLANDLYAASAGAERVLEILDERPQVTDHPGAYRLPEAKGRVEFEHVTLPLPRRGCRRAAGRLAPGAAREHRRARRSQRRRQDHARQARPSLL